MPGLPAGGRDRERRGERDARRAVLAEEQKRRPAVSSQARTKAALKYLIRLPVGEERLLRNPALPLGTAKKRLAVSDVPTTGGLKRLLAQPTARVSSSLPPEKTAPDR